MIRTVIIEAGIVTNVVMHDPDDAWTPPDGAALVASDTANIGDSWDGSEFAAPEPSTGQHRAGITARLDRLDAKSIRPLRAILSAQAAGQPPDPADMAQLSGLKAETDALRAELAG